MSLESQIQDLIAALDRNTSAILISKNTLPAPSAETPAATPPKTASAGSTKKAEPKPVPASEPAAAPPAETQAPAQVAVEYAQVRKAIVDFQLKNGNEATLAKLAKFGVKSGKELPTEKWAEAIEAFKAAA